MKSIIVTFVCIFYCCQAGVPNGRKGVEIDGKNEALPAVTDLIPEVTKIASSVKEEGKTIGVIPVGPTPSPNTTTTTPKPTDPTTPTKPPTPTTKSTTTTPITKPTTSITTPTTTVTPTTTNGTTPTTSVKPTTPSVKPSPTSTESPISTTTSIPPANRGFDGPSFIGGIVLASGLMAIGFVALKFYRARTELNYHTL